MKHVLILGACSDMAQALAHEFSRRGFTPILAARQAARLAESCQDLEIRYGVKPAAVEFDMLDTSSHQLFYQGLPAAPEVAICVAGYLGDPALARTDFEEARRIIDTNYTGPASILHVIATDFEKRGSGCIIGIGSVAGDRGRQSNYVYGSSKAGFAAFLSGLRNRLARAGVHVLTVKPGFARTKMTAGMKLPPLVTARPEQVARDIYRAYLRGQDVLYTLWMWRWIMLLIRMIPERIFKRMSM